MRWDYPPLDINPVFTGLTENIISSSRVIIIIFIYYYFYLLLILLLLLLSLLFYTLRLHFLCLLSF